jgi:hypothetical protein
MSSTPFNAAGAVKPTSGTVGRRNILREQSGSTWSTFVVEERIAISSEYADCTLALE